MEAALSQGERVAEDAAEEFAAWVTPHLLAMSRLAARLAPSADRDDVVQEALARAWRRRTTYDPSRGSAVTWLLAIVANQAWRARRSAARRSETAAMTIADADGGARPDRDVDLDRAIRTLPWRERTAVTLYYFLDLDVASTADVMGCAEGTVKATLNHARAHLRRALEETP